MLRYDIIKFQHLFIHFIVRFLKFIPFFSNSYDRDSWNRCQDSKKLLEYGIIIFQTSNAIPSILSDQELLLISLPFNISKSFHNRFQNWCILLVLFIDFIKILTLFIDLFIENGQQVNKLLKLFIFSKLFIEKFWPLFSILIRSLNFRVSFLNHF